MGRLVPSAISIMVPAAKQVSSVRAELHSLASIPASTKPVTVE